MKIGIITESQRKRRFLGSFGRMRVRERCHPRGFNVTVVELGMSAAKLEKIKKRRPKKFVKILRRAEREFISRCIKSVVIGSSLKPVLSDFSFGCVSIARGENEFYVFLPSLIRKYKSECGMDEGAQLGIRDYKIGQRAEFLVDALYREFKSINIYVENPKSVDAEYLSERIFDETGLLLGISESPGAERGSAEDVFADLINNRLRVGSSVLVNKIEPEIDLLGCDISAMDLCAAAELKNCAVKSCAFC